MLKETIKLLKEKPDPVLLSQIFKRLSSLGCIHQHFLGPAPIKLAKVLWVLSFQQSKEPTTNDQ